MKKRLFACFLIVCVALAGGLAALSVLPHSHGSDLDHSKHKNCAVYQFSLGHSQGLAEEAAVWTFFFLLLWLVSFVLPLFFGHRFLSTSTRAPPAVL